MAEKGEIHTGIEIPGIGEAVRLGNPSEKIQGTTLYLTQAAKNRISALRQQGVFSTDQFSGHKLNKIRLLDLPTRDTPIRDDITGATRRMGEVGQDSGILLLRASGVSEAAQKEPVTSHNVEDKISLERVWGVRIVNDKGEHVDIPIEELTTENPRKKTTATGTKTPDSTQQKPPSSDLPYPDETSGLGHEENPTGWLPLVPIKPKNPTDGLPLPHKETPPATDPPTQETPPVDITTIKDPPPPPLPPMLMDPPPQEEPPQRTHALIGYSERGRILDSARKMAREWMEEAQKKLSLKDFIRRITKHNLWKFWYEDQYEKSFTSLLEKTGSHLGEDLVAEIVEKARTDVETGKVKLTFRQRIASPLLAKDRLIFSHAADLLANDPRLADVRKAHEQASRATVTRFMDETGKLIHTKAGEHLHVLDSKDPNDTFILNAIRTRIQAFVTDPTMTEEQFQKNMTQFFQSPDFLSHAPADVTSLAEMDYFASSLLDAAKQFRQELAQSRHEQGTQQLDEFIAGKMSQMTIILGVASTGARTKVELTQLEKMQRRLKGFGGLFVNETTLGTAVAASLLTLGNTAGLFKSSAANIIAPVFGGSAVAGIFAGIAERQKLTAEGMSHRRSREVGNQYDSTIGGRRQRILELSLLSDKVSFLKSATDIRHDVLSSIFTDPEHPDTLRLSATSSEDDVKKAISALSDARARIAVSDDPTSPAIMVSYSSEMAVEAERTALDIAVAQSEKALTAFLTDPKNEQIARKALGVPTDPITADSTHTLLATAAGKQEETHKTTVAQAARAFGTAARNEAIKKGAMTFAVSFGLGTIMRGLSHALSEQVTTTTHPTGNELHLSPQGTSGYKLPEHFSVNGNADLVYTDPATGRASMVMDNFPSHLGANGDINAAGISEAAKNGFVFGVDHTEQLASTLFSGKTHELIIAGQTYTVPQELTIVNPDGDALGDIVIHASPINGQPVGDIIIAHNVGLTVDGHVIDHSVLDQINASQFLDVPPGTETVVTTAQHTLSNAQMFTDAMGGNHIAHVTLPDNVHLTAAADGTYTMTNANHDVIASGIKFQTNGEITNPNVLTRGIESYNNTHLTDQIHYNGPTQESFTILEKDPGLSGNFTMKASEWDPHGGYWTYVEKTLNNNGVTLKNPNADVNAIKHLLRGYEQNIADANGDGIPENIRVISHDAAKYPFQGFSLRDTIHGPELNYPALPSNPLANDTEFTLPKSLFSLDAMKQIVTDTDKAIELYKNGVPLDQMDRLHQILWKVGYSGMEKDIPGKDDILFLMDHYGGGTEHQIQQVIFNQSFSAETVSHTITGVMPQGAQIVSYVASQQTTVPGGNNWWDYLTPGVPLPREPLDKKIKPGTPPIPEPPGPPKPPIPFYFGYGSNPYYQGLESWKLYTKWLENIGILPPQIPSEKTRDVLREQSKIQQYLVSRPKSEQEQVQTYVTQIKPMEATCRVAVTIPAYHEQAGIYHTLEEWANQTNTDGTPLDKNLYEIDIIVNREADKEPDGTLSEIQRFMREHPDVRVNVIDVVFQTGSGGVGAARKLLADIVLQRSINRGATQTGALYIESEDADLLEIDQKSIFRLIKQFDEHPIYDALRGKQDLAPLILKNHDYLFFERRVERVTELLLRNPKLRPEVNPSADSRWNTIVTGGWNTAFTAEAYALIGGYQPVRIGEDVDIGSRISLLRGKKDKSGQIIPNTRVIGFVPNVGQSNPRRFIYALVTKKHAYHTFGDHAVDEAVHNSNPIDILNSVEYGKRISLENKEIFESVLNTNIRWLRDVIKDPIILEQTVYRLMYFMGFRQYKDVPDENGGVRRVNRSDRIPAPDSEGWKSDYHFTTDGQIIIDNVQNIAEGIETYRKTTNNKSHRGLN